MLIIVVTAQSLALAYTEAPRWKRLFLTLPFPFTLVVLSVGRPIDASSFASIFVLFLYTQVCRILHTRLGVPIVPSILLGITVYVAIGWVMAGLFPSGDLAFWIACAVIAAFWSWTATPTVLLSQTRPRGSKSSCRRPA